MVEPAVKSSEWSTWAALRAVGSLLLVIAFIAGGFWATADVDTRQRDNALLDTISAMGSWALIIFGVPAGYLWFRGRRRAEDEAERAGRAIKDAQDEYDYRPRPVLMMLLFVLLATSQLPTFAAKLLALIEDGSWLKATVAGTVTAILVLIAALSLVRLVAESLVIARRSLAGGEP
jgi:hypothetical protein